MRELTIAPDDPRAADVRALIDRHQAFARAHTPPAALHALGSEGLLAPDISFFSGRRDGELLAIGALRMLDATHAELKSVHTAEAARGQGVGRAMVEHLVAVARARGVGRVSIETGPQDGFAPARALYRDAGFVPCEPFGEYVNSTNSVCMTLQIDAA